MSLADAIQGGGVRITIRMGAACEPLTRAEENAKRASDWVDNILSKEELERAGANRWDVIDSLARYFHPGHIADPKTRVLDAARAGGAMLYFQMERGEFNADVVKHLAPTLHKKLPNRPRGTPAEYLYHVLFLAACLVCHEAANLQELLKSKTNDDAKLFERLYWLERFFRLWERTKSAKPPNLALNAKKQSSATKWQGELRDFRDDYLRRNPSATMRRVVTAFCQSGANRPQLDRAYRWALVNLK